MFLCTTTSNADFASNNFIYGGNALISFIHSIICAIFKTGKVPDSVRTGMLSPVFKNKGENINDYKGIIFIPTLSSGFF
jgi:hypothetical protein